MTAEYTHLMTLAAHAKVNLCLAVKYPPRDGYHELDSVFQELDLHDVMEIGIVPRASARNLAQTSMGTALDLICEGVDIPTESNLVFKALDATDATRFDEIKENPLPMLVRVVAESAVISEDDRRFVIETTKALVDQMRSQVRENMNVQRQHFNPRKLLEQLELPALRDLLKRDDEKA